MSASTTPTFWPEAASAAARFTVTDDLPTPPLPLATAYTRVSEVGWANGISGSGRPPRSWVCSAAPLLVAHHVELDADRGHAGQLADRRGDVPGDGVPQRAARDGQVDLDDAPSRRRRRSTFLTMPSSVIGRWISGSCTPSSAWVTCSALGGLHAGRSWFHATHVPLGQLIRTDRVLRHPEPSVSLGLRSGGWFADPVGARVPPDEKSGGTRAIRRPVPARALDGLLLGLTRGGVEQQDLVLPVLVVEAEHLVQAARHGIERPLDLAQTPVAFDEADDRGLVRAGAVRRSWRGPTGR